MIKTKDLANRILTKYACNSPQERDIMELVTILENFKTQAINAWVNGKNAEDYRGINSKEQQPRNTQQLELDICGRSVKIDRVSVWNRN